MFLRTRLNKQDVKLMKRDGLLTDLKDLVVLQRLGGHDEAVVELLRGVRAVRHHAPLLTWGAIQ